MFTRQQLDAFYLDYNPVTIIFGVSKARDTYLQNSVSCRAGQYKWRVTGGGFDMVGTVIGKWLTACIPFVEECKKLSSHNYSCLTFYNEETKQRSNTYQPGYSVLIDGGVGVTEIMRLFREVTGVSLVKVARLRQKEIYRIQYDLETR